MPHPEGQALASVIDDRPPPRGRSDTLVAVSATGPVATTWPQADRDHADPGGPGVPVVLADSIIAWSQPLVTTAVLVLAALTIHPLGPTGRGLAGLVLLVACGLLAYGRSVPDRFVPAGVRLGLGLVAAVAAGLLFGLASGSWAVGFAYIACGHAGFRFRPRTAAAVCALTVAVALVTLLAVPRTADSWPWWTALTVWGPVVSGLMRQNRVAAMQAARELVVQTRRAAESERQASALAERTRVARDIHDVLAHALSGVSVHLDLTDALLEAGRIDEGRAGVHTARGLVVDGLVEARRAVLALRDGALDVGESLRRMVQDGESIDVDGGLGALDAALAQAVVRIVQESLTNARRHAPGASVAVVVRAAPGTVVLDVVSASAPGAPVSTDGSGMGLVGIRERVADAGGTSVIGPETSGAWAGGWRVHAELPDRRPVNPRTSGNP